MKTQNDGQGCLKDELLTSWDRVALGESYAWILFACGGDDVQHQLGSEGVRLVFPAEAGGLSDIARVGLPLSADLSHAVARDGVRTVLSLGADWHVVGIARCIWVSK